VLGALLTAVAAGPGTVTAVEPPELDRAAFVEWLERVGPHVERLGNSDAFRSAVPSEHRRRVENVLALIGTAAGREELAAQEAEAIAAVPMDHHSRSPGSESDPATDSDREASGPPRQGGRPTPGPPPVTLRVTDPAGTRPAPAGGAGSSMETGPFAGQGERPPSSPGAGGGPRSEERGGGRSVDPCPPEAQMPVPDGLENARPGTIVEPSHDAFLGTRAAGFVSYSGEPVTLGTGADGQPWMLVRVVVGNEHLDAGHPLAFDAGTYDVRVWLKQRPGDRAATMFTARSPHPDAPPASAPPIRCFAEQPRRGLAEIWVPLTGVDDPGFQLFAEVVEDDRWFMHHEPDPVLRSALGPGGADLLAASDQVFVHVGQPPLDTAVRPGAAAVHTPAGGAFLRRSLVVDDDGNPADDAEGVVAGSLRRGLDRRLTPYRGRDLINDWLYGSFLAPPEEVERIGGTWEAQVGWLIHDQPPEASAPIDNNRLTIAALADGFTDARIENVRLGRTDVDLSWVPVPETEGWRRSLDGWKLGDPLPDPPATDDGDVALRADVSVAATWIDVDLRAISPLSCAGSVAVRARSWALGRPMVDPAQPERPGLEGAGGVSEVKVLDLAMPAYNWVRPGCIALWAVATLIVRANLNDEVARLVSGAVVLRSAVPGTAPLAEALVTGLDLPDAVRALVPVGAPASGRPGASSHEPARAVVGGLRDSCAPARCPSDDSLLTSNGVEVLVDGGLGVAADRWPLVYRPATAASVGDLVRAHASAAGRIRDVGVAWDGGFINVALNALARLGHLDDGSGPHGPLGATVAPMFLPGSGSAERPVRVLVPDDHLLADRTVLSLTTVLDTSGTVGTDGSLGLDVTAHPDVEVLFCGADYDSLPRLADTYEQCGRLGARSAVDPIAPTLRSREVATVIADRLLGRLRVPTPAGVFGRAGISVPIGVGDGALETKFGHLLITANRRVLPADPGSAVVTLDPDAAPWFTFRAAPDGFPGSGPYEVTWTIQDPYSGWTVDTTACTNQLHCYVDPTRLPAYTDPGGMSSRHHAEVTVTVTRAGVTATATRTYSNG
jgi:hypothetical protein